MADLTVAVFFTENNGQPATGLTLTDIDLYLTAQDRATGVDTVIWDGTQHPTEEIDNIGSYIRIYANADQNTYNYFARGTYTGAVVLDVDDVQGGEGALAPLGSQTAVPTPALPASCVGLHGYAEHLGFDECGLWGVRAEDTTGYGRAVIWSRWERENLLFYLAEAQDEIEQVVNYPLCTTWIEDEYHPYACPTLTDWGKVVQAGIRATSTIQADAPIDYTTEPAAIGPYATTITDTAEVHVYYPDSDREIAPQSVQISGGFLTVWVPRCRMVSPDSLDTPSSGLDYSDISNFLAEVDLVRVYNDPSTNAELVRPCTCGNGTCVTCSQRVQTACMYVGDPTIGEILTRPATYSGGWVRSTCSWTPAGMRLNYQAGPATIARQDRDAVIRLAHSKMPDEPCGDKVTQQFWRRDRNVPDVLTRERINCPFGMNDGAWIAWRFAQARRILKGGVLIT